MNKEQQIKRQLKFVKWLKSHKMYDEFASAPAMRGMMRVWEQSEKDKRQLRKAIRKIYNAFTHQECLNEWDTDVHLRTAIKEANKVIKKMLDNTH